MTRVKNILLAAAIAAVIPFARPVLAQEKAGLDEVTDERLLNDLASRGLRTLLDRAFETNKTPDARRKSILARVALTEVRTGGATMPIEDKRKRIKTFVEGVDQLLPSMRDARALISDANTLITHGIEEDQHLLENFGENLGVQARLLPVANAVDKMLRKASEEANTASEKAQMNWPAGKSAWEAADQQKRIADYTDAIIGYSRALAMVPNDARRPNVIDDSIKALQSYDSEDNPGRYDVQFYLAKLNLAAGTAGDKKSPEALDNARKLFDAVIEKGNAQDVGQQYDARMQRVVVEIVAGKIPDAEKQFKNFEAYANKKSKEATSSDEKTAYNLGIHALQFRLFDKQKKNKEAMAALDQLVAESPALRPLVLELMSSRVAGDTPVAQMNSLLLQTRISAGEAEVRKGATGDKAIIAQGIEAIREYIKREKQPGTDKSIIPTLRYMQGFFLEAKAATAAEQLEAAQAYTDYLKANPPKTPADEDSARRALGNGLRLSAKLRLDPDLGMTASALFDDLLKIGANAPFNDVDCQFELGQRLAQSGKHTEAVAWLSKVPATSKNYPTSRYLLMVARILELRTLPSEKQQAALGDLGKLIDEVNTRTESDLKNAADDKTRIAMRWRLAQSRLAGADLALSVQKDAKRALSLVDGFEELTKGLEKSESLQTEVTRVRLNAYMALGDNTKATETVVNLIQLAPAQGGQRVYEMLTKIDSEIASAQKDGRSAELKQLVRNRAELTPHLVDWTIKLAPEEVKKNLYRYQVFDAESQRLAAEITDDPAERKKLIERAMARFEELRSADNLKKFQDSMPEARSKPQYDPQVLLGISRTNFDLGNWQAASDGFGILWRDKAVGPANSITPSAGGAVEIKENTLYWEVLCRWCECYINLNDNLDNVKKALRNQVDLAGDQAGGTQWKELFQKLRKDLIPDYNPAPPTPEPASDPATPATAPAAETPAATP